MPFVERKRGKIVGVYAVEQGRSMEELPVDDPGLLDYLAVHQPMFFPPVDMARAARDGERLQEEFTQVTQAISHFAAAFVDLEIAMSALFYTALNLRRRGSQVPYAIFFGMTGAGARAGLIATTLDQLSIEDPELVALAAGWKPLVSDRIQATIDRRNMIAHGAPLTVTVRGKPQVRLTSAAFDPKRVTNKLRKGDAPGYSAKQIAEGRLTVIATITAVDSFNDVLNAYFRGAPWKRLAKALLGH